MSPRGMKMKTLSALGIMVVLVALSIYIPPTATAEVFGHITGIVLFEGTEDPVTDLEIVFNINETDDNVSAITNDTGHFSVALSSFNSWTAGDYINIIPGTVPGFIVCHATLYCDPFISSQEYFCNLIATPFPEPYVNYADYNIASMWINNRDSGQSGWRWWPDMYNTQTGENIIRVKATANGVIFGMTPCYYDNMQNLPENSEGYITVTWYMWSKYHTSGFWGDPISVIKQYPYKDGGPVQDLTNVHNFVEIGYSRADLLNNNIDIRIAQSCVPDYESGWSHPPNDNSKITFENIKIWFTLA